MAVLATQTRISSVWAEMAIHLLEEQALTTRQLVGSSQTPVLSRGPSKIRLFPVCSFSSLMFFHLCTASPGKSVLSSFSARVVQRLLVPLGFRVLDVE